VEAILVLLGLGLVGLLIGSPLLAILAFVRASRLSTRIDELEARLRSPGQPADQEAPPSAAVPVAPSNGSPPAELPLDEALPARPAPATPAAAPPPPEPAVRPAETGPPAGSGSGDFVTGLGPRLLVAVGALAMVMALGFFVKYAWENEWVGPAGRVLTGAVAGLGLVAAGVRLLGREYRPLGQGLAGAGLAALYISAFAAHGFYELVPRELAGFFMLAVTASAVLLSVRLDTRLLAALAWLGAYLTPLLLSTGRDQALALFVYLAVLAVGALLVDRYRGWGESLPLAFAGTLVLYVGLRALAPAALGFGGLVSVVIASQTDRPVGLLLMLLSLAVVAALARSRWNGAETLAVSASGLAVLSWLDRYFVTGREGDALLLALPIAGTYLLLLVARGLILRRPLWVADVVCHVANAGLLWAVLYNVLYEQHPALLGAASLALAILYLSLGLAAQREVVSDALQVRATLSLAALFLTLAIPVQLGLHGITLAWAAQGVVLLALGLRFRAGLARLGAYGVLGLALLRLLLRHLPLHPGALQPFTPVVNPAFGTWLFVVLALGAAVVLLRRASQTLTGPERALGGMLAVAALALLFGLLTGEVQSVFSHQLAVASQANDAVAASQARLMGGLALSLLWTLFATGLLSSGLALRSRPLFYAAYGLFAVTAIKVVVWDLATLHALYRIASFLALGVLLMAGAYLNLRFRARLAPEEASP